MSLLPKLLALVLTVAILPEECTGWIFRRPPPRPRPPPPPPPPPPTPINHGSYAYKGCYKDGFFRDMGKSAYFHDPHITLQRCADRCRSWGYAFTALQAGRECYCGHNYGKYGTANNCNQRCQGDHSMMCGGSWANSVYSTAGTGGSSGGGSEPAGECRAWGDPHYFPYDGKVINFMGTCTYLMTGTCGSTSLTKFEVHVKNEHRGWNWQVAYAKIVQLNVAGHAITLKKGRVVLIDGQRQWVPVNNIKGVKVFASGQNIVARLDNGVTVSYDGNTRAAVSVPAGYKKALCGLCGNFDGNWQNDWKTKQGRSVSGNSAGNAIGNSWQMRNDLEGESRCTKPSGPDMPKCPSGTTPMAEFTCGPITSTSSVFAACARKLGDEAKEMYKSCVTDVCTADGDKRKEIACASLETLEEKCTDLGFTIKNWRLSVGCPIKCGAHQVYGNSITACPATCANPKGVTKCELPNVEGCKCQSGYVMSGLECVPISDCGCVDSLGSYHGIGDTWMSTNCRKQYSCDSPEYLVTKNLPRCDRHARCELFEGTRQCKCKSPYVGDGHTCKKPLPPGECRAWGDPHYYPFDGQVINFMGTCTYLLTGTCKSTSLAHFEVRVKNEHRGWNYRVAYTKVVQLHFDGHVITLEKGRHVKVDGARENMPVNFLKGVKAYMSGADMVIQMDNGVIVRYDGNYKAAVTVPGEYKRLLCGMCGNFDGNSRNDWETKDGDSVSGNKAGTAIGNSWQIAQDIDGDRECSLGQGPDLPKCPAGTQPVAEGSDFCGAITNRRSKFAACARKLGRAVIKEMFISCVTDVCTADKDKQIEVKCASLETLANKCKDLGYNLVWRQSVGCGLKCDADKVYGSSISACPRTCAQPYGDTECTLPNIEGCQCKAGHVLSGTTCVSTDNCGCVDPEGRYRTKGEKWISHDCTKEYTCISFTDIKTNNLKACHAHAKCELNEEGTRHCKCTEPYLGDGVHSCAIPATPPPPTTKPPEPQCVGKKIDLAFVMDESSSIKPDDYERMKDFSKGVVDKMPIGPDATQVAMMTFSNSEKTHFTMKHHHTKERVKNAIGKVTQRGGGTYTHKALGSLVNLMSTKQGARNDAVRVAILITDGKSEKPEETKKAAAAARAAGITLITVGVGNYDRNELNEIASDPDDDHVFEVSDFDKLQHIIKTITRTACSGSPPPTLKPTTPGATVNPSDYPKYCDGVPESQRHKKMFMIDSDGPNHGADPFKVECDFSGDHPLTILHNKQEKKMCMSDCKERDKGCFNQNIQYAASGYQTRTYVKNAQHCTQTVRYDCKNAAINSKTAGPNSWWVNGKGQKVDHWPGGSKSGGCACGTTNSCAKTGTKCNCDAKDNVWRHDEGKITDKNALPVTEMAIGDINNPGEEGCITMGPLICY